MDRYARIVHFVTSQPWAIRPEMAVVIGDILAERRNGVRLTAEDIDARLAAAPVAAGRVPASDVGQRRIALIPIVGVIAPRMELMTDVSSSGISPEMILQRFRAAMQDASVSGIVLDIDSPGGTVRGLVELGDEIFAARGKKPVIAVANGIAASAAYWIASQAEEFVVTPSSEVGSIGVLQMHEDYSEALAQAGIKVTFVHAGKYKVEGNPYEALGDEARESIQSDIDAYYRMFTKAVSRGRRVSVETVRKDFGEGRMVLATDAAKRGMVDRVETIDSAIARLAKRAAGAGAEAGRQTGATLAADAGEGEAVLPLARVAEIMDQELGAVEISVDLGSAVATLKPGVPMAALSHVEVDPAALEGREATVTPIEDADPRSDYYRTTAAVAAAEV